MVDFITSSSVDVYKMHLFHLITSISPPKDEWLDFIASKRGKYMNCFIDLLIHKSGIECLGDLLYTKCVEFSDNSPHDPLNNDVFAKDWLHVRVGRL